jgi:hypothetical protein
MAYPNFQNGPKNSLGPLGANQATTHNWPPWASSPTPQMPTHKLPHEVGERMSFSPFTKSERTHGNMTKTVKEIEKGIHARVSLK